MKAWFWTYKGQALFVGRAGAIYPDSRQVEPCTQQSYEEACDVFMRQVEPYKTYLINPNKVTVIYYKTIQEPPT